ncbi:MAG: D-sedoheptulose-7-phosphate isomerase [Chloroflexota bacterium]
MTEPRSGEQAVDVRDATERYFSSVAGLLRGIDRGAIERVVETIREAQKQDACVFIVGNGGSAATCAHFANDLLNATRAAGRPLRVFSLADNTASLTGLPNDDGFEHVFAIPVASFARPGDVLIAISASGNSPNVLRAVETAHARGARTVGLVGFDGGRLARLVDVPLLVASAIGAYGPVEDAHLVLQHLICTCLRHSMCAAEPALPGVLAHA